MKLLIATDCFLPRWDGIVRFLLEILPSLDAEITIIAPDFGQYSGLENVNVVQFPIVNMDFGDIEFTLPRYGKIKKIVKEHDLVFSQTIGPLGMAAIRAGRKYKKRVVAFAHSIEWELSTRSVKRFKLLTNSITRKLARRYYNRCDTIIVPSEEVREKFIKNHIDSDFRIVHLGTDTKKFHPGDKQEAKEKLGLDPYKKLIGFTGRIGREKDLITLYRAFRRVEKKHFDTQLVIVGKGVQELEELFSSDRNIIMPGAVNNVPDWLRAFDIFVLPSLTETSSLATMEAMATGLPVITTPVGFVKEYVKEKHNGMLFPFKNSLVLSMKIEMLLENDELRAKLGENARATIEQRFQWENTREKIKNILMEATASG